MAGITQNTSFTLDGKTNLTVGQWGQLQWWTDGKEAWADFFNVGSPQKGLKVNVTLADGPTWWGMSALRFAGSGEFKLTITDKTTVKDGAFFEMISLGHGPTVITLKNASATMIRGGNGDDDITTGAGFVDYVRLSQGDNEVTTGLGWVDTIVARDGDDQATIGDGGAGSVNLGKGDNVVKTGKGWVDSIVVRDGEDKVTVGRGAAEFVSLGGGNDTLVLTPLSNTDNLVTANGGSGSDLVDLSLLSRGVELDLRNGFFEGRNGKFLLLGFENVIGSAKSDELTGTDAANDINGGKGSDRIIGGKGADELTGGAGGDRFIYLDPSDSTANAKGRDLITDFTQAQKDKIDLSAIDAIRGGDDDDFAFIGSAAFTKTKGTIRFDNDGETTFVYGDVNGDRKADFAIEFDGGINFKAADFVL